MYAAPRLWANRVIHTHTRKYTINVIRPPVGENCCGLSFQVWRVAVYGANLLLIISIVIAILVGLPLGVHPQNSLMVASCLTLSSNVLATKLVDSKIQTAVYSSYT